MSNGKFYKKVSFSSVRKGYDLALELNVALGVLLKKERFARRMEHLGLLGGQECPDKPGTDKRCSICYPFSGRERMAEIRAEMGWPDVPVKVDLVDSMRMDKPVLATEPLLKKQSDDIPVVEEGAQSREEFEREAIENLTPEKTEPEEEFNFGEIRESELPF